MSQTVTLNGVPYVIPDLGDDSWGDQLTDYFVAQASGLLQKAGGTFTLTGEVDFGATYGVKTAYIKSRTTNPASAGVLRLAKTDAVKWRNNANGADLALGIDGSDLLTFNGTAVQSSISVLDTSTIDLTLSSSVLSADIIAGSITNAMINASAAIAYSKLNLSGSIVNADVNASAAIAYSKLALSASIVNADVSGSAAIAYSKLNLSGSILNADINASAAIDFSKLAALSSANILVGNVSNVATSVAVSGAISLSNAGVTAYVGTVPATKGGTGLTSGTSGGVPYFSSTTTIASSALLAAHGVVLGGGAAAAPATLAPDSSTSKVLVSGGSSADPAWALLTNSNLSGSAAITNANLASVATATFKGRTTAGSGAPEDLTATQATALLNQFTSSLQGVVPGSGGGTTTFLRADGSWATPSGAGDVTGPASSVDNELVLFSSTSGKVIKRAAGSGAVSVASGVVTQGTLSIANGGTANTTASAAFNALSPISTLGDIIYGGTSGVSSRLAGNITTTRQALSQTGSGAASAAPAWINFVDTVYTPTVTNNTNCAAITVVSNSFRYMQIGSRVFVTGLINVDPTAAAPTITRGYISIPTGANFANLADAAGCGACEAIAGTQNQAGVIYADSGSQRVVYDFSAVDGGNHTHGVSFMYTAQ